MRTYGDGDTGGIVRFDIATCAASRLPSPTGSEYTDLTLGFDGLLYAYYGSIGVYDPASGSVLRGISSPSFGDIRGIAVDAAGMIYAADWNGGIRRFDATGQPLGPGLQTGASLVDIDINASGEIVLGSRFGSVFLTHASLQSFTRFKLCGGFGPTVHVAFAQTIPEPPVPAMMLTGLGLVVLRRR